MASICFTPIRVPAVRVTKLDACGAVVPGLSSVSSSGIVTIEQEAEVEDRQDYFTQNADADWCIRDTAPPKLKWINVTITFCSVDPEMQNIMTAEPLVLNDAVSPSAVGFRTRENSINNASFAFEAWTRIGGSDACSGGSVNYGYLLMPWVIEGQVSPGTMENGAVTFTVTGRTSYNSQWGVGPYNIRKIESGVNAGDPAPLLTPITSLDHRHLQVTNLAPPVPTCGAIDVDGALTVIDGGSLEGELTIPAGITLPATVDWGDANSSSVPVGAVSPVTHTYAAPGTYTVTMYSSNVSSPIWTGDVTIA